MIMASTFKDLQSIVGKLHGFLEEFHGVSTYQEALKSTALETRRIIDELFDSPDIVWKKEKSLMHALHRIAAANANSPVNDESNRIAKIIEAAKIIHRADSQEELNRGLDNLQDA